MPRQARAVVTRTAILEAAAHILASGGLAAFNTNAVAARAGVSIGSLYQYFPNKDALMAALIETRQAEQADTVSKAFELCSTLWKRARHTWG
jgi:AcrR family transcriptional regulator